MTLALIFDSAGFGEWFVLLAVVLVVVGPHKLPAAARKFGSYYAKFRRAAESFKRQIMELEVEANRSVSDLENEVNGAFKVDGDESTARPLAYGGDAPDPEPPVAEPAAVEPTPVAEPGKES